PLARAELRTDRPLRLPSVLRHLGPLTLETFVARIDGDRHPDEAWLWGARLAGRPHPRLTLGINRASLFGTEAEPATAGRVLRMFVGVIRNSDFENQVLSFDAAWRLPTEDLVPATVYLEWGADDGAGALNEQPARIVGIRLPGAFSFPELTLGAEYTRIQACCGHGSWYFNGTFRGNWAVRDRPLAHPLGGQGWEGMGYVEVDGDVLRLEGRGFARSRHDDNRFVFGGGNLFTPGHEGRSYGGSVEGVLRLARGVELRAGLYREDGDNNWREERRHVEVTARF
ncbi:MAG TPA: capsule assembly Wzi family protein, partial [Longimicrobium sp.]|nr:capsule assembly Wzi family protein [Longimicrobium sp.]